ncbi:MAG: NADH-quinone oxidoreductase subunit NuoE [Balneolaceae bacterium]|nr:NAD(P)H-dependent oxidoreductase subunit E [Bacteroidota bacterium]
MTYEFTKEDLDRIESIKKEYPEVKATTLQVLWVAQDRFGHVDADVQRLVAATLELPEAHVHGVASFYTQYYKQKMGKHVLDVCTCLSCQLCGGYDILNHLEKKLGIKAGETTKDGMFSLQQVECLGACGYAPMLQVTNGEFVNHLTEEKVDQLLEKLRNGEDPEHEMMEMPLRKQKENP